ncbi:PmoA family protein [Humibacter sp. RRB41]|uniref:DUF6807 domain-containing protein n=1 Tax=Humibacter sp. RRB41 TaxID=2919946 RepID=UPI001FAAAC4B|nr:PmoA family protein [Humibacter sp. RRB41]
MSVPSQPSPPRQISGTAAFGTTPFGLEHDVDRAVRVISSTGADLLEYVYRPDETQYESPRPYVHPVRTLSGRLVTVFRPWDHVWHKGITMALPNVGPDNFWGGATYSRAAGGYADLGNNGSQDHDRVTAVLNTSKGVTFAHDLTWHREPVADTAGEVVIKERRTLTVSPDVENDAWILGWRSELTNDSGAPIELGSPTTEGRENAGYGGLFWRGPRSFTGGRLIGADGTTGEDVRGTTGTWAGLTGRHDGRGGSSTVVFADVTPQQRLGTKWFVRSEPFACINPAPFFDRVRIFEPGETLDLRYAVTVADGEADAPRMATLAAAAVKASEGLAVAHEISLDAGATSETLAGVR